MSAFPGADDSEGELSPPRLGRALDAHMRLPGADDSEEEPSGAGMGTVGGGRSVREVSVLRLPGADDSDEDPWGAGVSRSMRDGSGVRLPGADDSDGELLGRQVQRGHRREGFKGADAQAARELDSKEFQPDSVDETKCRALLLNRGYGKLQCCGKPVRGSDLCAKHSRRLLWDRLTDALSQEVFQSFDARN